MNNDAEKGIKVSKGISKKVLALASLALVNVLAVGAVSVAWFITMSGDKDITAFSGDLNVKLDKITAYKQVYPFYGKSTTLVDYGATPTLKSYVIEDSTVTGAGNADLTEITISGTTTGSYVTTWASDVGSTKVHLPASSGFKYFLVGDAIFTGVANNPWSTTTGVFFPGTEIVSGDASVTVTNVVLSAGATFSLVNSDNRSSNAIITYSNVSSNGRFAVPTGNTSIRCLKSGIYDITYSASKISFRKSRADDAVIGNNMLDPTMIKLQYDGSESKKTDPQTGDKIYPNITDYLPVAIQGQQTMVVFDVELTFINANPVNAGLKVFRGQASSIGSEVARYSTSAYTTGYVDASHRNAMTASDFYTFYTEFSTQAFQAGNNKTAAENLWNEMHAVLTNAEDNNNEPLYSKFQNEVGEDYEKNIECSLHAKTGDASFSTIVPGSLVGTHYHCYIAVDYDYDHVQFFLNEHRLGKTFLLDRDFGFYFFGTQVKQTQTISSTGDVHTLEVGDTLALSTSATGTATWFSSDNSIATVSNSGVVTAISTGRVTIRCRVDGYYDATYKITITEATP